MSAQDRFPPLLEDDVSPDPLEQFRRWFRDAEQAGIRLPEAMVLATASSSGRPAARVVLLKGIEDGGFVFYTNYESRKGRELAENEAAALVFYWDALGRQVRIEGQVERVAEQLSDEYFRTRPLGSRLGAWASRQSDVIASRDALEVRLGEVARAYADAEVPRPPYWGGYRLIPAELEFWQHRDDRLHDRLRYLHADGGGWTIQRLSP